MIRRYEINTVFDDGTVDTLKGAVKHRYFTLDGALREHDNYEATRQALSKGGWEFQVIDRVTGKRLDKPAS